MAEVMPVQKHKGITLVIVMLYAGEYCSGISDLCRFVIVPAVSQTVGSSRSHTGHVTKMPAVGMGTPFGAGVRQDGLLGVIVRCIKHHGSAVTSLRLALLPIHSTSSVPPQSVHEAAIDALSFAIQPVLYTLKNAGFHHAFIQ